MIYLLTIISLLVVLVSGHSWMECVDFRPTTPGSWKDGQCMGRPRSWGKLAVDNEKPFDCYREFRQDQHVGTVCNPNREGPRTNPATAAYDAQNPMTVTTAGAQLCMRWPAKNHDDDKGYLNARNRLRDHPVFINWSPQPIADGGADPTQDQLNSNRIVGIDYQDCTEVGTTDQKPCGGCFNVPNDMKPGTYTVQWWWEFNDGEIYISCADVQVKAGGTPAPARAYPAGYVGCYNSDPSDFPKSAYLWTDYPDNSKGKTASPATCREACKGLGFTMAALVQSTDCWCTNSSPSRAKLANDLVDCAMQCSGERTQTCGGNKAYSIYNVNGTSTNTAPTTPLVGSASSTSVAVAMLFSVMVVLML